LWTPRPARASGRLAGPLFRRSARL
jgi:hypothetical protein